jgi:Kef-type K+ transport system membrane component KefB
MAKSRLNLWLLAGAGIAAVAGLLYAWEPGLLLDYLRSGKPLERLTFVLFVFVLVPPIFERLRLPSALGLILAGVALGPFALGVLAGDAPTVELFSSLGRVLLMFFAGLEVDMRVFQRTRQRSLTFGALTFLLPLAAGTLVGRLFEFNWNASVLIGSLLASHTLLGYPILARMGLAKTEVVAVTLGATVFTDVAALLVLAITVSIHVGGFGVAEPGLTLGQLAVFTVLVLVGVPFLGLRFMRRYRDDETAVFMFTLLTLLTASIGAHLIHLEDIVGAFMAGLAVNRVVGRTPAAEKLRFLGEVLFIPAFFFAIGLRLDLPVFAATLVSAFGFVAAIVVALLAGKLVAAAAVGALFRYRPAETLTMWSLSLPQVAATLAAAVAAYSATNDLGDRLISEAVLNAVIVLMVATSVLGPVLTDVFGKRLGTREEGDEAT